MANLLELEIITPDAIVASTLVHSVTLPGTEGQFTVLPGHAALVSSLEIGELSITLGIDKHYYAITNGFAEVYANKVTILVETAERADRIDKERALKAKIRAKEQLARIAKDDRSFVGIQAALMRAMVRLKVAGRT